MQLVPVECQPVGQAQPHMSKVPVLYEQVTWLSQEPGQEKLQLSLVIWYPAGHEKPQELNVEPQLGEHVTAFMQLGGE